MNAVTALKRARKKIENPEHWTQGVFARDEFNQEVLPEGPDAVRWCALGALKYAKTGEGGRRFLMQAVRDRGFFSIVTFNDSSLHKKVLEAFDSAIALAKKDSR